MAESSARFSFPLLVPGQAQKEITHNEALLLVDALLHPSVVSCAEDVPAAPAIGACWIVPLDATGDWDGREGAMAIWTEGGWRFVMLPEGARVWVGDGQRYVLRRAGAWEGADLHIPLPDGGAVVDVQARAAIAAIVAGIGRGV